MPALDAGQVLLRVEVCGVCRTDLHLVEGEITPAFYPIIPGHQAVGVVEQVGKDTDAKLIGQRVGVPWLYSSCGQCDFCRQGQQNLCPDAQFTGFDRHGGFARYLRAQAKFVLPLPKNLSSEKAAPLLCAGIIGYRSLHISSIEPGQSFGLVGFGASAHIVLQIAKARRMQVSVFTRSSNHRRLAAELGADWVGGLEDDIPQQLHSIILFAPAGELVPQVLPKLRPGGTLAINAIYLSPIPQLDYELLYGERILRTVANATYQDGLELMQLVRELDFHITTQMYAFEQANQALQDLKHSRINGEAVLRVAE